MGNGGSTYDLVTKELTPVATETAAIGAIRGPGRAPPVRCERRYSPNSSQERTPM
jgi:hypothetical protein